MEMPDPVEGVQQGDVRSLHCGRDDTICIRVIASGVEKSNGLHVFSVGGTTKGAKKFIHLGRDDIELTPFVFKPEPGPPGRAFFT